MSWTSNMSVVVYTVGVQHIFDHWWKCISPSVIDMVIRQSIFTRTDSLVVWPTVNTGFLKWHANIYLESWAAFPSFKYGYCVTEMQLFKKGVWNRLPRIIFNLASASFKEQPLSKFWGEASYWVVWEKQSVHAQWYLFSCIPGYISGIAKSWSKSVF